MQKISILRQQAISAARNLDWAKAIEINEIILTQNEKDVEALNRLGIAYLQLNDLKKAKKAFTTALEINKLNPIAKKNLEKIKNNQNINISPFTTSDFIEEPGKAKVVSLHRLAGKQVLTDLSVGQACKLIPKNRYISVETNESIYIGAIPEDLSFRLSKLIENGNVYSCTINSCNSKVCNVHIREVKKSKKNSNITSFPINRKDINSVSFSDEVVVDDDIPIQIVETDHDVENYDEATIEEINS